MKLEEGKTYKARGGQKVKMSPYIFRSSEGAVMVSGRLFDSEESAQAHCSDLFSFHDHFKCEFIRWLGGTPYEVEVPDEIA